MKKIVFDNLPEQLCHWTRASRRLPDGVQVSGPTVVEAIFVALFPDTTEYRVVDDRSCIAADGRRTVRMNSVYESHNEPGRQDVRGTDSSRSGVSPS